MAHLSLSLLGSLQIALDDKPLTTFRSDKERALLAYLALEADRSHRRESLIGLLWPNQPEHLALNNLRKSLSRLRQTISDEDTAPSHLLITSKTIQFNLNSDHTLDMSSFTTLLASVRMHRHRHADRCTMCHAWLEQAARLYRGELLHGFFISDCVAFEEWLVIKREQLHRSALDVLGQLTTFYEGRGDFERAQQVALRQVALEPWRESAHRQLMSLFARSGQRAAALAQYAACQKALADELGVEPERATTALYEQIRHGSLKLDIQHPTSNLQASNLPSQTTPFIGREAELARLSERLLDPTYRMLTLVGEGGVGKTRLALAIAERVSDDFLNGARFAPLAGLNATGHDALSTAIAAALGFTFSGNKQPKEQLLNYLRSKELLLILDNFEHLLEDADMLVEILQSAPSVTLLVTSREPLDLQAEVVVRVEGLPVPFIGPEPIAQDYASVQLFSERADRASGSFVLNDKNLPHIIQVCRFVEGLPLGIELAAAWMKQWSPEQIATALRENLDFLATTMRDIPERHRSMRAVFEGSWRILSAMEQATLAQSSLFRGGFSAEAADAIAPAASSTLATLVSKSLIKGSPTERFELHELLRQFAAEKLATMESAPETTRRYSDYYLEYLGQRESELIGREPQDALAQLRTEFDNIGEAWRYAVKDGWVEGLARGLSGLVTTYELNGQFRDGTQEVSRAIESVQHNQTKTGRRLLGWLYVEQARLTGALGQYVNAKEAALQAIALGEAEGESLIEAWAHFRMGRALWMEAYYETCRPHLERALQLAQAIEARDLEAECLLAFSALADTHGGNYAQARAYGENALQLFRQIGNRRGEVRMLNLLGNCSWGQGDYAQAQRHYEESLHLSRMMNSRPDESIALANLGTVHREQGDHTSSSNYYDQALQIFREVGDLQREFITLQNVSLLYHHMQQNAAAETTARQAIEIANALQGHAGTSLPLTCLGHALLAQQRHAEAAEAYRQSLELRREVGQSNLATEPLAGLARTALAQGDIAQAVRYVEEILSILEHNTMDGTNEPTRIKLTMYQVLAAAGDPRANDILESAHRQLMARAEKISDPSMRRSFLENVAANREIGKAMTLRSS